MTNSDKPTAGCGGGEVADQIERVAAAIESGANAKLLLTRLREIAAALRTQASAPRSASAGDGVREALELAREWMEALTKGYSKKYGQTEYHAALVKIDAALASNPLEGKGIQSHTEQASSGVRSPDSGEG